MIERGIKLKDAITLYQGHWSNVDGERLDPDDILTSADWRELQHLLQLLQPLKDSSLALQSKAEDGSHGALWEQLTTLDYLLHTLEELKSAYAALLDTHFKACINLGWKKLDKYYTLSDNTPAYRLAIFLHPHFKYRWFEENWHSHPQWIKAVHNMVGDSYKEAHQRWAEEVQQATPVRRELSMFERYNLITDARDVDDELQRYAREERTSSPSEPPPLQWWRDNHHRYPVLRHPAFKTFAAPAGSAADERAFSQAGQSVNNERPQTLLELTDANLCLRGWYDQGLI